MSQDYRKEKPICEYCNEHPSTQVHHAIKKFYAKSLFRFDKAVFVSVCGKCHFEFHANPLETMRWFQNARNQDYLYLLRRLEEYDS